MRLKVNRLSYFLYTLNEVLPLLKALRPSQDVLGTKVALQKSWDNRLAAREFLGTSLKDMALSWDRRG
jgi:hypothetical protein